MDMSLQNWVLFLSVVLVMCPVAAAMAQALMARLSARHLSQKEMSSRLEAIRKLCPLTKLEDCMDHSPEECSICMGEIASVADGGESLRQLPCCHVFHADCVDVWIAAGKPCPMCRKCPLECDTAV
jgi:E3 ubiquitin-protein ligase ATL6/9/15/31/42/55